MLPLHPRGIPVTELGLPPKLLERVAADDVIRDTWDLSVLHPDALKQEWKLKPADIERINKALAARGMRTIGMPTTPGAHRRREPFCKKPGRVEGTECGIPKMKGRSTCAWHWILSLPIAKQIAFADERGQKNRELEGHVERTRVPEAEWPEGARWCSECQQFVPWIYVVGTKCKAHASRAQHASMVKRVYDITGEEYDALLAFQGGRCYICGQEPKSQRLAVDHDHRTNEVRGLLCANDAWGCNVSLRRLLNSLPMAQRALEYVTMPPWVRLQMQMNPPTDEPERIAPNPPTPPAEVVMLDTSAWNPFGAAL